MKKIVVYRDAYSHRITAAHDATAFMTQKVIDNYNNNNCTTDTYAELVELEEDSLAYEFYRMKLLTKDDMLEELHDLNRRLDRLNDNLEERIEEFEKNMED